LTNTSYAPLSYGHARAQDFRGLVDRGMVAPEDYERFIGDQEMLDALILITHRACNQAQSSDDETIAQLVGILHGA